jgi:hypothetical protein
LCKLYFIPVFNYVYAQPYSGTLPRETVNVDAGSKLPTAQILMFMEAKLSHNLV